MANKDGIKNIAISIGFPFEGGVFWVNPHPPAVDPELLDSPASAFNCTFTGVVWKFPWVS